MRWSRDQEPVFYSPKLGYWVVTRYDDIKAIFRDNTARLFGLPAVERSWRMETAAVA